MSQWFKTMLTSLATLVILGGIAWIVIVSIQEDPLDNIVKHSYQTPEITTDIQEGGFVRIQFQVVTDGKKAREEISKRDFQLQNILIKELALLTEREFTTGLSDLETIVQDKLNELMVDGKVLEVYTISKILQ